MHVQGVCSQYDLFLHQGCERGCNIRLVRGDRTDHFSLFHARESFAGYEESEPVFQAAFFEGLEVLDGFLHGTLFVPPRVRVKHHAAAERLHG